MAAVQFLLALQYTELILAILLALLLAAVL